MKTDKLLKRPGFALFISILKRSFWVPLVLSILDIVIISFTSYSYRFSRGATHDPLNFSHLASELNDDFVIFFLTVAVSAVIGCVVFSYLNKVSSAAFIHGLPIGRTELFFANYLAGTTMIFIPALASAVYMAFRVENVYYALLYLGVYMLYGAGTYSFAVLVSQLSANTLGSLVFTAFGLATPIICEGFIIYLMNENLFGYAGTYDELYVSRLCYLEPRLVASPKCLIYIGAIAVFTAVALILFKKRAIELAGDLIAFGGIRKAAVYVCGLVAGMCAYLIFSGSLFMFLLFGLICAVLVNFAVRKKFTIKGAITPCSIVVATAVFIAVLFHFDLTGFERRIPDIDDVESVRFYNRYLDMSYTTIDGKKVEFTDFHTPITNRGEIEKVINLHKNLIGNKNYYSSALNNKRYTLTYKLKNGKTLERRYVVYLDRNKDAFKPVTELYGFKRHDHDLLETNIKVLRAEIQGLYGNTVHFDNPEDVKRLHEALVKDIVETKPEHNHDLHSFRGEPVLSVRIYHYAPNAVYSDGTAVPEAVIAESETRSDREYIYPCYTNTLAAIMDIAPELLDTTLELPGPSSVTIQYTKEVKDNKGSHYNVETYNDIEITDPEVIREIIRESFLLSDERTYNNLKDKISTYYIHFNIDERYYFDFRIHGENELITKYVMEKNPNVYITEDVYYPENYYSYDGITVETASSYITY